MQPQGLLAVGKIVVAGHDDESDIRVLHPAELDNLQAVHDGDVDIHNDDIRLQGIDFSKGLHAVGGLAHHLAIVGLPVKELLEALPDHNFIVNQ